LFILSVKICGAIAFNPHFSFGGGYQFTGDILLTLTRRRHDAASPEPFSARDVVAFMLTVGRWCERSELQAQLEAKRALATQRLPHPPDVLRLLFNRPDGTVAR